MTISLTQGLHRSVQQTSRSIATVSGRRRQDFGTLGERVARLAGALRRAGMAQGDRVAMLALNSDRYLEYYLATMWGGGVVNPCNIRWSPAEIAHSLDDCETRLLIVDDEFTPMLPELRRRSRCLTTVVHVGEETPPPGAASYEALLAASKPVEDAYRQGDDMAGIFYTGGTTGTPKGVVLSHGNIFASSLALAAAVGCTAGTVYLHGAPMFHMADTAVSFAQVICGGSHVMIPRFTPDAALRALQDEGVTATLLVPLMIQMLVDQPGRCGFDCSSLGTLLYGASPMSEPVLRRAMAAFPGAAFIHVYGMTELSPLATLLPFAEHLHTGPLAGRLRAAGRAALCADVRIVGLDGREAPRGTVGEVAVRGPNVMLGYWNRPELTAAAVRDGWMHTGDGAYMDDDGFIYVVDRLKDMIVTGGENVYSAEVENALMQHPSVSMCAVIAVPDAHWGERVHAVIVRREGTEASEQEVVAHCRSLIAGYKCPRSLEWRDSLPVSGAGKILKAVLREPFWQGVRSKVN